MKRITNVAIGGKNFIISEEACEKLKSYLSGFESMLSLEKGKSEVMDDIEERIAELFSEGASGPGAVVDTDLVSKVIMQLGMPDGSTPDMDRSDGGTDDSPKQDRADKPVRRYYRELEGKKLAGVCSGLSVYFNIDVTLVRLIAFMLMCCYCVGVGFYILMWILAPVAVTPAQKCELRGIPATAANMYKFSKKQ